jgi:hypothetical protein
MTSTLDERIEAASQLALAERTHRQQLRKLSWKLEDIWAGIGRP